jgi:hypothetical protein
MPGTSSSGKSVSCEETESSWLSPRNSIDPRIVSTNLLWRRFGGSNQAFAIEERVTGREGP